MRWLHSHYLLKILMLSNWDTRQCTSEERMVKWEGNNRNLTAKCPTNVGETSHDVKIEWNKSMSAVQLCRPHRRVKNYGKKLSTEVYKADRKNVLNNHGVILGHLARQQMTGISTLRWALRHLSRAVSMKFNKTPFSNQVLHSAGSNLFVLPLSLAWQRPC